jgi:hypothetical protein
LLSGQCDQIGRIFASWAIAFFGHFLKYKSGPNFGLHFFNHNSCLLISAKMDWARFWAIFFTNASGHPVSGEQLIDGSDKPSFISKRCGDSYNFVV